MEYLNLIIEYAGSYPYLTVLGGFCLMLFLCPLPEEAVLFVGGTLSASHGGAIWIPTLICGIVGVFLTDYEPYILAKVFGQKLIKKPLMKRLIPERRQERAARFVQRFGAWAVLIVRFMPGGLRNPTFAVCGLSNISQKQFIAASLGGACITSQVSFWGGYFLSDQLPPITELIKLLEKSAFLIGGTLIAALLLFYYIRRYIRRRKPPMISHLRDFTHEE